MIDFGEYFPDIWIVFVYPVLITDTPVAVGGHGEGEFIVGIGRELPGKIPQPGLRPPVLAHNAFAVQKF